MKTTKEVLIECLNNLNPKNVLDLGIGFGRCSIRFLKKSASVTGVDSVKRELPEKINFIKKNIKDFVFNEKYDLIIAGLIFHFFREQDVLSLINKIKENTVLDGYNFILCVSDKDKLFSKNKENFYPSLLDLERLYSDWDIIKKGEYETPLEEHGDLGPHQHNLIFVLFKK